MKNQPTLQTAIPAAGYTRRYRPAELLGISLSALDRWVRSGETPKSIKLGEKSTTFDTVEINCWLEGRRNTSAW